jgi:hypothetical protein
MNTPLPSTALTAPVAPPASTLSASSQPQSLATTPPTSHGSLPAVAEVIQTQPLAPRSQPRKIRRNGRVASLPKLERDMVNRMIWNAVPYKNIVAALDDAGYSVTERNISNWATGGYLEWRFEQEAVLLNRLDQDQLLDFLRRDDAQELPEVGLQAAATRLSQLFLQKLARADDPEIHLDSYSKLIDILCRLNREIAATQKSRDDSRRTLGPEYNPAHVKEVEQFSAIENERFYSNPPDDSGLSKAAVPPLLPVIPTASFLAEQAREEKAEAQIERLKQSTAMWQALKSKLAPDSNQLQHTPAPASTSTTPLLQRSSTPPLQKSKNPPIHQSTNPPLHQSSPGRSR